MNRGIKRKRSPERISGLDSSDADTANESVAMTQQKTDRPESSVTIDNLPTEMLWEVFSYLDFKDLVSVCSVSRRWKDVGNGAPLMTRHKYFITPREDIHDVIRTLATVPNLRNINIKDSAKCILDPVLLLIEFCSDVRKLDIDSSIWIEYNLLGKAVKKFPKLESLSTPLYSGSTNVMIEIGSWLQLQTLVIENSFEHIDLIPITDGCPSLVHLNIQRCMYYPKDFIYLLRRKKHLLQSLLFSATNFNLKTIPPLSECTSLEHVDCNNFWSNGVLLAFLHEISSLSGLKHLGLELEGKNICEDVLNQLSKCSFSSALTELDLHLNITTDDLPRTIVTRFSKIRKLYINNFIKHEMCVIGELLELEELQHVEIVWCKFSRCWFEKLLECKQIKSVVLDDISSLSEDVCLELVRNMELRYLKITDCCSLTNRFLQLFPYSETLKELYVSVRDPSEQSVEELQLRLPSTRIDVCNLDDP